VEVVEVGFGVRETVLQFEAGEGGDELVLGERADHRCDELEGAGQEGGVVAAVQGLTLVHFSAQFGP